MSVPLEEALECPKCGNKGEVVGTKSIPRSRNQLLSVKCVTQLCPWYDTRYVVTKQPDGTAPDPVVNNRIKTFPELPKGDEQRMISGLEELLRGQMRPGGSELG